MLEFVCFLYQNQSSVRLVSYILENLYAMPAIVLILHSEARRYFLSPSVSKKKISNNTSFSKIRLEYNVLLTYRSRRQEVNTVFLN
jgi:hypothetical protein